MNKLKLRYSTIIPFPGFYAINLFGYIIRNVKYKGKELDPLTKNHELIHTLQAEDFSKNRILGYTIFYILYILEWLIKGIISIFTLGRVGAYHSISFEQEAYYNDFDLRYLNIREKWNWINYITKLQWRK